MRSGDALCGEVDSNSPVEDLDIEHCPQKEYTATAKATLERSFRTVKGVIAPIVEWSSELARRVPQLRNANLARCIGRLVVSAVIEAHRIGSESRVSRQTHQDPQEIRRIIDEMRDQARADERSKRIFLERMHGEYPLEGSLASFIRSVGGFALEDIQEAERRFRDVIQR